MTHPIRLDRSLRRLALAAWLIPAAVLHAGCDSPSAGGGGNQVLRPGEVLQGTVAARATTRFRVEVPPSVRFRLLLRATGGSAGDTLVAELVDDAGTLLGTVRSSGADATLEGQATGWIVTQANRRYEARVRGLRPEHVGPFSAALFVESSAPERVPAALALGQAVEGEAIDVPGDVDEFTLTGSAGDEWIVFAQGERGSFRVQLVDAGSQQPVGSFATEGPTEHLELRSSGRLRLPTSGGYLVRVAGAAGDQAGGYRLRVDRVVRAPEAGGSTLPAGPVEEALAGVGDVDEWVFTATAGQEVGVSARLLEGLADGIVVELSRGVTLLARLALSSPTATLDEATTGRVALPETGSYTLRVQGVAQGSPARATGRYQVEAYTVDRAPEGGTRLTLGGGAVSGAIERPGDVDEYTFSATAGQMVVAAILGPVPARGQLMAQLVGPGGNVLAYATLAEDAYPAWLTNGYTERVVIPASGTYTLRVWNGFETPLATGPYTAEVYPISTAPESLPAELPIGASVTGERIDRPGDIDVFTFRGEPGRVVNIFLGSPLAEPETWMEVRPTPHMPAGYFAPAGSATLDDASIGRLSLRDTTYTVTVAGSRTAAGPYGVRVFPIDFGPETVPRQYTLGDTIRSERLYPAGDVDEFELTLAAPERLRGHWEGVRNSPSEYVAVIIRDAATGQVVWYPHLPDGQTSENLDLPAGRYLIRVLAPNFEARVSPDYLYPCTGPYVFALVRR